MVRTRNIYIAGSRPGAERQRGLSSGCSQSLNGEVPHQLYGGGADGCFTSMLSTHLCWVKRNSREPSPQSTPRVWKQWIQKTTVPSGCATLETSGSPLVGRYRFIAMLRAPDRLMRRYRCGHFDSGHLARLGMNRCTNWSTDGRSCSTGCVAAHTIEDRKSTMTVGDGNHSDDSHV